MHECKNPHIHTYTHTYMPAVWKLVQAAGSFNDANIFYMTNVQVFCKQIKEVHMLYFKLHTTSTSAIHEN